MKKIKIFQIAILLVASFALKAQFMGSGTIAFTLPTITPNPYVAVNQTSVFKFNFNYQGDDVPYDPGDPVLIQISLSNVLPVNIGTDPTGLSAITVTGPRSTDVSYDAGSNTYYIIPTTTLSDLDNFIVTINVLNVAPSPITAPHNGLLVDLAAAPNGIFDQGAKSSFVYTLGNILPISLSNFDGTNTDCNTNLSWVTATTDNAFDDFEIEYSSDGTNFINIGKMQSKFGSGAAKYAYTYPQPDAKGYYRLKLVSKDNTFTYSAIISVVNSCKLPIVKLYPNPIGSDVVSNLTLQNFGKIIFGRLIAANGKQLQAYQFVNGVNKFSIGNLPSGEYVLVVSDEKNNMSNLKIIVAK